MLAVKTTPANVRDETMVQPLLDALDASPIRSIWCWMADRGYGFDFTVRDLQARGIESMFAERDEPPDAHGSGLGVIRRVVEQTFAHFGLFRRIRHCYEKTGKHFQAFHELAAALLCYKRLVHYQCYTERL